MKIAAAHALAELAREDVPDEVAAAYGARPKFGPDYIIPVPFDPRLISDIPPAVAKAAMDTGVARKPIVDMDAYQHAVALAARSRSPACCSGSIERLRRQPQARGLRRGRGGAGDPRRGELRRTRGSAPRSWSAARTASAQTAKATRRSSSAAASRSSMPALSRRNAAYADYLYERLQRKGFLQRDCQRLVNQDRNHFAACMVALGDADAMVTGVTRNFSVALDDVLPLHRSQARPPRHRRLAGAGARPDRPGRRHRGDTRCRTPRSSPTSPVEAAGVARRLGYEPRLALLAFSTFGHPPGERAVHVQEAVQILDQRRVDFEYDGEMAADVALNHGAA